MIYNSLKKIIISFALVIVCQIGFAQQKGVGIGTDTPNASALLDVDASNLPANGKKGVLTPHVTLANKTDIVTIANPAVGLLVFNTTNSATDTDIRANTFYFWNGTRWMDVATSETLRSELYLQVFTVGNTENQSLNAATLNTGTPIVVEFNTAANEAINIDVGNRISLTNNNFRVLSAGSYEITGYVGYNPWIATNCTTYPETNCIAGLDFILQKSTDNGTTWSKLAKSVAIWGVGTGNRNRSVMIAPFVVMLNQNDLVRGVVIKGAGANHGTTGSLNIEAGTGLRYSRVLRFQKLN